MWWHSYGIVLPDDDPELAGCWVQITLGGTEKGPEEVLHFPLPTGDGFRLLPYLWSWDHEPSDEEKATLEPPDDEAEVPA